MNHFVFIILLFVIFLLIFLAIYISIYNKLQKYMIRIKEAESEIDESLRKKFDLLSKAETIINSNTSLKQDNFTEFAKKDNKYSNFDMDRKLTKIEDIFSKITDDYPDDLDLENFRNLRTDIKINNEKNEAAKAFYNTYTTKLNLLIKKFPSNIIARIHNIDEHLYFDNKNMNDDDILDFKY